MSLRCDHCHHLGTGELRSIIHAHHSSLLQLKSCAKSKACCLCALFWEYLRYSCRKAIIQEYRDGWSSDATNLGDTKIFLQGFLTDTGLGASPKFVDMINGATIQVSLSEFASSRVHGIVSVYAKLGKSMYIVS